MIKDVFDISRKENYENAELIRRLRKKFPEEDIDAMAEVIMAYKTGKKIFLVMFWTVVFTGFAAMLFFGFRAKFA